MRHIHRIESLPFIRQRCEISHTSGLRLWLAGVAIAWVVAVSCMWAQSAKPTEYQVKAAYLYNFGRFVEWPGQAATPKKDSFTICVLGVDPFGRTLDDTLAGANIAGKSVVAKRISTPEKSDNCQILFVSAKEDSRLNKIIGALDKESVLTVSDMPQFSERGGMIQFVLDGNRVRFEVNLNATQKAGLTLSSELLKVASAITRDRD